MLWMKKWISNPILIILQNDIQKEGPNVEGDGLNGWSHNITNQKGCRTTKKKS